MIHVDPHPLLDVVAFRATFPVPLGEAEGQAELLPLLRLGAVAPFQSDDPIRSAVRDMLRLGGYKPTGRGKPASEYLLRAASGVTLGSINPAVDACNVVSLHSGLPISVVDLDRTREPLRIAVAPDGNRYVFNATGQEIDLDGLVCLWDADGPCANPVKDAQRTKTTPSTRRTLSIVWSTKALPGRASAVADWYVGLLNQLGADCQRVEVD